MSDRYTIREITDDEVVASARLVRKSFRTVADEYGFTRENAPRYTAFSATTRAFRKMKADGYVLLGLFNDHEQAGFIGVEDAGDGIFHAARLAVLPRYRHDGYGRALLDFVFDYARKRGGNKLAIGIVNEQTVLKKWYQDMGFVVTEIRSHPGLPFTVGLLEKDLG